MIVTARNTTESTTITALRVDFTITLVIYWVDLCVFYYLAWNTCFDGYKLESLDVMSTEKPIHGPNPVFSEDIFVLVLGEEEVFG
jgi:hypothetical protein